MKTNTRNQERSQEREKKYGAIVHKRGGGGRHYSDSMHSNE